MFFPVDFVPFSTAREFAVTLASHTWLGYQSQPYSSPDYADLDADLDQLKALELQLLSAWLISQAFLHYQPYICSPSGQVLGATEPLTAHEDRLNWYEWRWPALDHPELCRPLLNARTDEPANNILDRFRFIDIDSGLIAVANREKIINKLAHLEASDIEVQIATARNFQGWAICFSRSEFPSSIEKFADDIGFEKPSFFSVSEEFSKTTSKGGRPSLQFIAFHAYTSAFPDGHANEPWKVVEHKVSERAGRRISARTIQRALANTYDKNDKSDD